MDSEHSWLFAHIHAIAYGKSELTKLLIDYNININKRKYYYKD